MARDENEPPEGGTEGSAAFYSNYDAKEVLGTGMSSVVRKCVEKATGKEYAVKIVDVCEGASEEEVDDLRSACLKEIEILRMVSGQGSIIQLHDFYESQAFLFIIFEICRGGELFDYLTKSVSLSEKKTRHIMRQLLECVVVQHSMNIVHRDLKPENILIVDADDNIKLTDFGFAYKLQPGEKLTELVGTPGYLAPELLKTNMYQSTDGYSLEVDIWACGVIMYTLMCGYAPFYHRKQIYMLRSIAEGRYEFRSPEWDDISLAAKDLIRKFLTVEPKDRITARDALNHPFFQQGAGARRPIEDFEEIRKKFDALKKFRLAAIQVKSLVRLLHIKHHPTPITANAARLNPYAARQVRRQIDATAFLVYGHWIKRGQEQNRDVFFANNLRNDLSRRMRDSDSTSNNLLSTGQPVKAKSMGVTSPS